MPRLIEELRQEHRQLLEILNEVKAEGIGSVRGRERLLAARTLLLAHISREDREFYPALRSAADLDTDLKRILDYFASDMEKVSKKALDLFAKHEQERDAAELSGDAAILYMTLKDRIRTEEEVLFSRYQRLRK